MEELRTNLLDCLGVSQMDRLLHLKIVVFIHQEKVNLLTVSAEKQCNSHKSISENWRQTGFGSGTGKLGGAPTCSGPLGLPSQLNGCAAGRQTPEDQVWA